MTDRQHPKDRVNQFLQDAYDLDTDQAVQAFYSNWADEYDVQLERELNYVAPAKVVTLFMQHTRERAVSVVDIGCGTGLTGVGLAEAGYQCIDGLDFSAAMLRKARQRNFYRELIQANLNQPLAIGDARYDAAISSGTFTHGHVCAKPLDEIFRIIKPGGHLVCTVHQAIWKTHGFADKIDALNQSGLVRTVAVIHDVYFEGAAPDGVYCVLQKC